MWSKGYKKMFQRFIVSMFVLEVYTECEAITNADFNSQIRNYAVVEDNLTLAEVKTLQKQGLGQYANFSPEQYPVKFKDNVDSETSESSYGRGFLHHGQSGYGHDYEEPHYDIGHGYEQPHEVHHDPHDYHQYEFHDPGHHLSPAHHHGYGHHHKYYDHGLATKALLWPIAGIALLGAAAALVSNPVLLQLGVVSGKRRRRNVEQIENFAKNSIKKWSQTTADNKKDSDGEASEKNKTKRMLRKDKVVKRVLQSGKLVVHEFETTPKIYSEDDLRFVPIPLIMKKN